MLYETRDERIPMPVGPLYLEVESNHFIDLRSVIDWDDTFDEGEPALLLSFPAPTADKRMPGPHCIFVSGKVRELALRYLRLQARRSAAWLDTLPELAEL